MRQISLTRRPFVVACLAMLAPLPTAPARAQKPPTATVRVAAQPLTNFTPLLLATE
jgi:hypothetical protein